MIRDRGASVTVYANAEEKGDYLPLCQSGGRFVAIGKPPAEAGQSDRAGKSASDSGSRSIFDVPESGAGGMHLAGIYSARTRHSIANVLRLGGSRESEACVAEGLSWLARHQADDGHWADHNKCEREQPCPPSPMFNYAAPVAETGLAVLAFQAGGNYHFNGRKYSVAVQRGLDWLIGRQKEDGCLFGTRATWYEHGIATFALAEACRRCPGGRPRSGVALPRSRPAHRNIHAAPPIPAGRLALFAGQPGSRRYVGDGLADLVPQIGSRGQVRRRSGNHQQSRPILRESRRSR